MSKTADLLVEIGTEELPPNALRRMHDAFRDALDTQLNENHLPHGECTAFATPRRLAVVIRDVPLQQPDRDVTRRGPALKAAFDADGKPTRPAEGFARSCGVSVDALQTLETDKGAWLVWQSTKTGKACAELLPDMVEHALKQLPVPKRMRWGNNTFEFVRPVHWIVLMLGETTVPATIMGITSGNVSRGHRFHHNEDVVINSPAEYSRTLEQQGMVLADMNQRRESIRTQVIEAGKACGGKAVIDDDLLDEVTALVEWPVAITGDFDKRFLEVPAEALVSSMQDHQKFFPVRKSDGSLMPQFITVANIASKNPSQVQSGNERVIRPRLEDAVFFWKQDRKQTLAERAPLLHKMTFQKQLGTLGDKQQRIVLLATYIAETLGLDVTHAQRAAELCKCDLLTSMVYEFPELQGIMGRYYALHDGENAAVAAALDEQYQPRFAGDALPASATGQVLALAERIDTLVGIFAIGQPPTGDKDPFALRRAALGVLRIIIEQQLELDLRELLTKAAFGFDDSIDAGAATDSVFDFIMGRLRNWYTEQGDYNVQMFEAVLARQPARPLDFDKRMQAVRAFNDMPEAEHLSAANKRIRNILRKSETKIPSSLDTRLLQEPAEQALADAITEQEKIVQPLFSQRHYADALRSLASLQAPVDRFFDDVMVMADDPALRDNRLALLQGLFNLFLQVADISQLQ
ncbi:MAG: glycine--tRNA ligase subunit beta [Gammaproteobacteria bacterium]|nr:glycine--tRNA ligase subunit beta [Gammaproteobacteria bacterium]